MANVYSVQFISDIASHAHTPTFVVPDGYRAVVRDFSAQNDAGAGVTLYGVVCLINGVSIAGNQGRHPSGLPNYRWGSIHAVANAGQTIDVATFDDGWFCQVSGYLLTLP